MNSKEQLLTKVERLAEALESVEKLSKYYGVSQDKALTSFQENIIEIDYIYNYLGELAGAEITMTYGDPMIWIDTRHTKVIGAWDGDRIERGYIEGAWIDEMIKDLSPKV
jgi:hypothetical protein